MHMSDAPRRSGHQRHHGADRARSHEEERRVEDLQSVINHRRDHARDHPRAGDGADQQQDDDGRRPGADVVDEGHFEHGPAAAVDANREHHADRRGRQQGDLASAVDGLAAEGADHDIEESRQHRQRNGRHPGRRQFFSIRLHILFLREAKVRRIFVLAPSGRPTCGLRPEETANMRTGTNTRTWGVRPCSRVRGEPGAEPGGKHAEAASPLIPAAYVGGG